VLRQTEIVRIHVVPVDTIHLFMPIQVASGLVLVYFALAVANFVWARRLGRGYWISNPTSAFVRWGFTVLTYASIAIWLLFFLGSLSFTWWAFGIASTGIPELVYSIYRRRSQVEAGPTRLRL
jgi:hypothetical protein